MEFQLQVEADYELEQILEIADLEHISNPTSFCIIISTMHVSVLPKLSFLCVPGLFCALKHGKKIRLSLLDKLQMSIIWQRYITTNGNGSKKTLVIFLKKLLHTKVS